MIKKIKIRMLLLYLLNVFDIVATAFLINQNYCREGNILMQSIVLSPIKSIITKILLPAMLMCILYILAQTSGKQEKKVINLAVSVGLIFYVLIAVNNIMLLTSYVAKAVI